MSLEYRNIDFDINYESRVVDGYAVVFNSESRDLGGFKEIISPFALDGVVEKSDIFFLFNHDISKGVLGRSKNGKGSLELNVDERGLHFRCELPNTQFGDEILELVKRGDVNSCSFAFYVDKETWSKQGDGSYIRTIDKIKSLKDVSVVLSPAYEATEVCARFSEILEEERIENERKLNELKALEEKRIGEYYDNIKLENAKYLSK